MSDGHYDFKGRSVARYISGGITVRKGTFKGENLGYSYSGRFSIEENTLSLSVSYKNRRTDVEDSFECSTTFENDHLIDFTAIVEGVEFSFVVKKAEEIHTAS